MWLDGLPPQMLFGEGTAAQENYKSSTGRDGTDEAWEDVFSAELTEV